MKNPLRLTCPVCDGSVMYYQKRAGAYCCRRCGAEFRITKVAKGIKYDVVNSPFKTTLKKFEKNTK